MTTDPMIIRTEAEYRSYVLEVERLAVEDPAPGTAEGDRLMLLARLVEHYEKERFPFEHPDPAEALVFRMEQQHAGQ
jgi:HTH-type transcriptional regulator/antitoxin HigA